MIIILLIVILLVFLILRFRHHNSETTFFQDLFKVVTLKVLDYFCKGTPSKVVMLYLKSSCFLYGGMSLTYPIIRAGIECNTNNSFGKLFLEFQWDTIGSTSSYLFLVCNTIVVIFYFWKYRSDDVVDVINRIFRRVEKIEAQNNKLLSNDNIMLEKLEQIELQIGSSSSIKQLLPKLNESIDELKVETASKYLDTIWNEIQVHHKHDFALQASILYLQGECARFTNGKDSKDFHIRAYEYMKRAGECDEQILEGMIFEACRTRDYVNAEVYSEELRRIDPRNYWCYVAFLMQSDSLSIAMKSIPPNIDIEKSLATCIMLGGGRTNNDLGVDISNYRYHNLESITIDNFALWILDLSVATTRFCQSFLIQKTVSEMNTPQCKDLFKILDIYLKKLGETEINNPLPDSVFLHSATGYFGSQNETWLSGFENSKPSAGMEELYILMYAIILSDLGRYESAKTKLSQYSGDNIVSILNMRFVLAIRNNDIPECIEIFKTASERNVCVPDHFAHYFFATTQTFYESVRDYVSNIKFESGIATRAYSIFLDFKNGTEIDSDYIISHKADFPNSIAPYMAIVIKEKNYPVAIEILEKAVDRKVLDLRTSLLIEYYQIDVSYSQKLYHLLKDLRKARQMDTSTLTLELGISNRISDLDNCLEITSELVRLVPNDINAWVNHAESLYRCGSMEKNLVELKGKFQNAILSTQATIILFKIYHAINETQFALDLLYDQIVRTQDQNLKDFFISMHLNPGVEALISSNKSIVELDDYVTLAYNGGAREHVITKGSIFEDLVGSTIGTKHIINFKQPAEVTIQAVHTKYYKLLRDVFKEIGENQASRNIRMFSIADFDFEKDPIGALRKMAGKTEEVIAREKALLEQYKNGDMSFLNFIKEHEIVSDTYEKIFNPSFMVCSLPVKFYQQLLSKNEEWKEKDIVLDITSLISLFEFDRKYGLKYEKRFFLPKSVTLLIKEQLLEEEKGVPKFFSQYVVNKIGFDKVDENKTILWNKLKSLEAWVDKHCVVETVEEVLNMELPHNDSYAWRVELESLLLTRRGMLLLTEDWCFAKRFQNLFPALSTYHWISLMGDICADEWEKFMIECGNVGYSPSSDYILTQCDLASKNLPNNYQTCLENVKYNPESIKAGIDAARSFFDGIIYPSKIVGATNMLSIMFSSVKPEICVLLIQREFIQYKNEFWHQCLVDALKISHPLIMPG